eukprot:scaffold148690_cov42-Cyclotella_meneghiniana.AAC.1
MEAKDSSNMPQANECKSNSPTDIQYQEARLFILRSSLESNKEKSPPIVVFRSQFHKAIIMKAYSEQNRV